MARGASSSEPPDDSPLWRGARARVGRSLKDKWHLDELLGVGGVAAVYAATHRNGRRVAVKLLHAECSLDPDARGRFLREGYVANKVQHAGVVSVLDDDVSEDGSPFLVMELLDGETIQARWQRKGKVLQAGEVLSIADQLLDVLAVAHERGIVHRDIKPANLFLTRTGVVKLLDFGVARAREGGARTLTLTGASPMGTPAFMPPEQALGHADQVDGRTDLWAVGATMLTLLSGRHVHEARTVNECMLAAMTKAPELASAMLPGMPKDIARIIDRALEFDPESRWANAQAMQLAVREAYQAWLSMTETLRVKRPRAARSAPAARSRGVVDSTLGALRIAIAVLIGMTLANQMDASPETVAPTQAVAGCVRERALAAQGALLAPTVSAVPSEPRFADDEPSIEDPISEPDSSAGERGQLARPPETEPHAARAPAGTDRL